MIWSAPATGLPSSTKSPATPMKVSARQRPAWMAFFWSSMSTAPRRVISAKTANTAPPSERHGAARRGGGFGAGREYRLAVLLRVGVHEVPLAEIHGEPV